MSDICMTYEDWLRGCVYHNGRKGNVCLPCDKILEIADWIEVHRSTVPTIEQKRGWWLHGREVSRDYIGGACVAIHYEKWWCSKCNYTVDGRPLWNYCPNCGAKMSTQEDLMTEFNKLENYLKKANCPYERIDTNDYGLERHMIFVPNEKDREWDCICFPGSFGYKDGLLEIMGNIVENEDDVEGYLTADDVIQRIEKTYGWSYSHDE